MKLVLDTDVIVTAMRSETGASRLWLNEIMAGQQTLLLSVPLALEYEAVLTRADHVAACKTTERAMVRFVDTLCQVAKAVELNFKWRPLLPDPGDDMVAETALNGGADWLLTFNDRHFRPAAGFNLKVSAPGPLWRAKKEGRV